MENPTALVNDDAGPTRKCSCHKLAAAGWKVQCNACGAGLPPVSYPPVSIETWPGPDPSPMLATTLAYVRAVAGDAA